MKLTANLNYLFECHKVVIVDWNHFSKVQKVEVVAKALAESEDESSEGDGLLVGDQARLGHVQAHADHLQSGTRRPRQEV